MKRVGYDADTGRYYFRDRDGSLWQGPQGAEYGQMTSGKEIVMLLVIVSSVPFSVSAEDTPAGLFSSDDEDIEAPRRGDGYQPISTAEVIWMFLTCIVSPACSPKHDLGPGWPGPVRKYLRIPDAHALHSHCRRMCPPCLEISILLAKPYPRALPPYNHSILRCIGTVLLEYRHRARIYFAGHCAVQS